MTTFLIGGTGPMPIPIISIPPQRYYRVIRKVDQTVKVLLLPAGGLLDMGWTMRWLERKILRLANPDEPIFIVGHSQGGPIAGWIGARHPDLVDKVVSVFGPWDGSRITPVEGPFSLAPICSWFRPHSPLMADVREEAGSVLGERLTSIMSPEDGIVIPFHSGYVPGARNVLIGPEADFKKHQLRFPGIIHLPNDWSPSHLQIGLPNLIQGICAGLDRPQDNAIPAPRQYRQAAMASR